MSCRAMILCCIMASTSLVAIAQRSESPHLIISILVHNHSPPCSYAKNSFLSTFSYQVTVVRSLSLAHYIHRNMFILSCFPNGGFYPFIPIVLFHTTSIVIFLFCLASLIVVVSTHLFQYWSSFTLHRSLYVYSVLLP